MMTKGYSIKELMQAYDVSDLDAFMDRFSFKFKERFGLEYYEEIEVKLIFKDSNDLNDFYNEIRFNRKYSDYKVRTSTSQQSALYVRGEKTLFDYFGTYEPNLLTASRELKINFDIEFVQRYSGSIFTGSVMQGELLSRQCIIEMSELVPELSLAGLNQFASKEEEFELLLTRVFEVKGEVIL